MYQSRLFGLLRSAGSPTGFPNGVSQRGFPTGLPNGVSQRPRTQAGAGAGGCGCGCGCGCGLQRQGYDRTLTGLLCAPRRRAWHVAANTPPQPSPPLAPRRRRCHQRVSCPSCATGLRAAPAAWAAAPSLVREALNGAQRCRCARRSPDGRGWLPLAAQRHCPAPRPCLEPARATRLMAKKNYYSAKI